MDPPCDARENVRLECTVLHQCIRPRVGAQAPDHHGNPRASELITSHASKGYLGHQFSNALERPFLHLLFFSRRPRWAKDHGANIAFLLVASTSFLTHAVWGAGFLDRASKLRPPWRTPQAMRAILLASAIASLNRLSRRAAASIQDGERSSCTLLPRNQAQLYQLKTLC